MGVFGAWPSLAENGASRAAVDTMQFDGDVYVDMLALYFGFDVSGSYVTCANCGTTWDRDDNGSHNIGWAAQYMVHHGSRPLVFCRPQKQIST